MLEDILVHLLTVKKYEMLCSEIQSQVCWRYQLSHFSYFMYLSVYHSFM